MLEPTIQALRKGRVVLASGSPRRHKIIKKLGINVEIVPSTYDEQLDRTKYSHHGDYVQDLAKLKVAEVYERLKADCVPPLLIIGADTLVTMGETIYGKPEDNSDAIKMLSCLANKQHVVYTGVCLKTKDTEINFYESARVKFGNISNEQIEAYVKTGESLDKAGGYGVQGMGACLIEKIDGDFYTVMGMPVYALTKELNKLFSKAY